MNPLKLLAPKGTDLDSLLTLFDGALVRVLPHNDGWRWKDGTVAQVRDLTLADAQHFHLKSCPTNVELRDTWVEPCDAFLGTVRGGMDELQFSAIGVYRFDPRQGGGGNPVVGAVWPKDKWPEIRAKAESLGWKPSKRKAFGA